MLRFVKSINTMIELIYIRLGATALLIILFIFLRSLIWRMVRNRGSKRNFSQLRIHNISKFFTVILTIIFLTFIAIVWDVSFQGLSIYFASFFAAAGIALFASWSILSNITASVILFFNYTMKVGSKVKIVDGDNSITGIVKEVSLFFIWIITDNGDTVAYPNNLAIQKPMIQIQAKQSL